MERILVDLCGKTFRDKVVEKCSRKVVFATITLE